MKPLFYAVKRNHAMIDQLSATELRAELGYDATTQAPTPDNDAVRTSLALVKSGVRFKGRVAIAAGPNAGHSIEPHARRLAEQLARPALLGQPQSIAADEAQSQLAGKRGVVFIGKPDARSGYIGLIEPSNAARICHAASHFPEQEIRFWPLA